MEKEKFEQMVADKIIDFQKLLLKSHKGLNLDGISLTILLHLNSFLEKGYNMLSISKLETLMCEERATIESKLEKLVATNYINLTMVTTKDDQKMEIFTLEPLYEKLFNKLFLENVNYDSANILGKEVFNRRELFELFEAEFSRQLSPLEREMIDGWISKGSFSLELIRAALKEAVYYGKLNMKYIQQILINWKKNNIRTIDEIDNYQKKHGLTHKKEQSVEAKMILEAMQHKDGVLGWIKENE